MRQSRNTPPPPPGEQLTDDNAPSRQLWKWSFVAAMAGYIDAGSIVSGAVGLNYWVPAFGLSKTMVGVLGAISSNAISAGVGALIGGWVCDKYGRKKIYSYDLLVYMAGVLVLVFAANTAMLITGYIVIGLAVGADIPASWSLITEFAPTGRRGRLGSLSQVLWYTGPTVSLFLGLLLQPLGLLGIRILFGHLFLIALVTYYLRHGVGESGRWSQERRRSAVAPGTGAAGTVDVSGFRADLKELLSRRGVRLLLMLIGVYGLWNLMAGTNGFYQPYLLKTLGAQSDSAAVGMQCLSFGLGVIGTLVIFAPLSDRVNRRLLFGIGTLLQLASLVMLIFLPLDTGTALIYVIALGIGGGFSAQHFFQLWSGEVFPTRLRATAQGLMFAVVRIGLGIWSFAVPTITATGFRPLAVILSCFVFASGLIGVLWTPDTRGKSLERIESDYGWTRLEGARPSDPASEPPEPMTGEVQGLS